MAHCIHNKVDLENALHVIKLADTKHVRVFRMYTEVHLCHTGDVTLLSIIMEAKVLHF